MQATIIPKISVLIPVYNVEKHLHQCLDSVVQQTLQEIEVICVDDGSTDNSGKICDEYAQRDSRFSVIHKPQDEGLLLARKTAVMQAKGEYIFFLDSDDYLTSEKSLSILLEEMLKDPVDILKFSAEVVDYSSLAEKHNYEKTGPLFCEPSEINGAFNIIHDVYSRSVGWTIWNKLYRRDICQKAYHTIEDVPLVMGEDVYAYFIIAYHANTFKCVACPTIYSYCLGSGVSTSSDMSLPKFTQYIQMTKIPV